MTENEFNKINWLNQQAYQQLLTKYLDLNSKGRKDYKLKIDLLIIQSLLDVCNRYIESEINSTTNTLNNITNSQVKCLVEVIVCYINKYNIKYKLTDNTSSQEEILYPVNAILTEANDPILTEGGSYILIE